MSKPKNKIKIHPTAQTILLVVLAAAVIMLSYMVFKLQQDIRLYSESDMRNTIQNNSDLSRYKTCYENNLKPCSDDNIRAYKEANGLNSK